jgi:hypothetical protein
MLISLTKMIPYFLSYKGKTTEKREFFRKYVFPVLVIYFVFVPLSSAENIFSGNILTSI